MSQWWIGYDGDDSKSGLSKVNRKKTWADLIPRLSPGDQVTVTDGTMTGANSGMLTITGASPQGSSGSPITVSAENERQVQIYGAGTSLPISLNGASYWTINGLYAKQTDAGDLNTAKDNIDLVNCDHIQIKRCVFSHNNRMGNTELAFVQNPGAGILWEECEFYYFHRDAMQIFGGTAGVTVRRCYANSRGFSDIVGGRASGTNNKGDASFTIYPSSNNIFENCISEGSGLGFEVEAAYDYIGSPGTLSDGNQFLGCISIGETIGIVFASRGTTDNFRPHNNKVWDFLGYLNTSAALSLRGSIGSSLTRLTMVGTANAKGFVHDFNTADYEQATAGFTMWNCTSFNQTNSYAYRVLTSPGTMSYTMDFCHAYNAAVLFDPTPDAKRTNTLSGNPLFAGTYIWIPPTSPLYLNGYSGVSPGASIIYKYVDGVLGTDPLWSNVDGSWLGKGATITGLNDVPGSSLYDVHSRLGVTPLLLPEGYGIPPDVVPALWAGGGGVMF